MAASRPQGKKNVAVLGATGTHPLLAPGQTSRTDASIGSVGQRFILLLADHPTLHLQAVGASSRSAGKLYKDAVRWKQAKPMSPDLANLQVRECKAANFPDVDLVFSGLDSDVAGDVGMHDALSLTFRNLC